MIYNMEWYEKVGRDLSSSQMAVDNVAFAVGYLRTGKDANLLVITVEDVTYAVGCLERLRIVTF